MKYYLAPMEGLTGYVYRNAHHSCYPAMDQYFTPFLSPKANSGLSARERNDILPEHNEGIQVIPQILTNRSEDFLRTARELRGYGYRELNLNLGCPSGTVVSKHKGAGFLELPDALDRFLEEVFDGMEQMGMELSIKTRLGMADPEEFHRLLEIYGKYPVKELILHPRVRTDYYKNTPDWPAFARARERAAFPVCYNGDLFTVDGVQKLEKEFPDLDCVMLGRGIIANPALAEQIEASRSPSGEIQPSALSFDPRAEKERLREFHQLLLEGYEQVMSGDRNVLFKMKEIWSCMIQIFDGGEPYIKKIKKSQKIGDYQAAVSNLLANGDIREGAGFSSY